MKRACSTYLVSASPFEQLGFQRVSSDQSGTGVVCRWANSAIPVPHQSTNKTPGRQTEMLKLMTILALVLFAAAIALPMWMPGTVEGQGGTEALTTDMDAKTPNDLFNGFGALGTPINECVAPPVAPTARGNGRFEDNKFIFSERETVADGLGPTYNDVGCVECHQSVDVGAFSQTMEFRAGHLSNGSFIDNPGGQLIHARGT